jgi:hypothetical protein
MRDQQTRAINNDRVEPGRCGRAPADGHARINPLAARQAGSVSETLIATATDSPAEFVGFQSRCRLLGTDGRLYCLEKVGMLFEDIRELACV